MHRFISLLLSALLCLGILSGQEKPAFTVESDQEAPFNDENLSVQVSNNDLLAGAAFTSNLPTPKGHPKKLTDGEGHEFIQGSCTYGENSTEDWIVTFSNLRIEELHEIRVFSANRDGRSQQDYDVFFSEDQGKTFRPLAKDILANQRGGYNLTRVPVEAGRVTDLRFVFRNPNERKRPTTELHSALYEIDVIGIGTGKSRVGSSLSEARKKGREQSRFLSGSLAVGKEGELPQPDLVGFQSEMQPLLETACVQCHGPEKQKGKFRVDTLNPDLHTGGDVDWWLEVLAVLSNHEMPPEDDVELADADRAKLIDWLSQEVQIASLVRRAGAEHTSFRRMTRYEYTNTLQDLLGLPYEFGADLPPETASRDGFRNSSEMLKLTAMQFETYRNLARTSLEKATVRGERPPTQWVTAEFDGSADAVLADVEKRVEQAVKKGGNPNLDAIRRRANPNQYANWFRFTKDGRDIAAGTVRTSPPSEKQVAPQSQPKVQLVLNAVRNGGRLRSRQVELNLGRVLPDEGHLRLRVWASRSSADNPRVPVLQPTFGFGRGNNGVVNFPVGESQVIDARPGKPQIYEWTIPLSEIQRNPLRGEVVPGRDSTERVSLANVYPTPEDVKFADLPAILIDHVEIAWPFYEEWPPESHRRVFPKEHQWRDEKTRAESVLGDFLTRAWRQPVEKAALDRMMALFTEFRPQCEDFEETILEVLAVGLASPRFLYLVQESEPGDSLTSYELATRLSYFLWCSTPDERLLQLAETDALQDPEVLAAQTKRMLKDPRSKRFAEQFVHQWLSLEMLDILTVDKKVHPTFSDELKTAMHGEIIAFFEKILLKNRSVLDFIESDYALVNERLAQHYGLPEVHGPDYQRVALTPKDGRGGLLTQGGVLAMTSNGIDSNPLRRGVWLLENLLHDPPPPPPPAVPEIDVADPEIAKMTLKQRLEQHRDDAACQSCHERIDPWGIAFENFDAIGNWRTTANNQPVDSHAVLFNKEPLDGMEGLKRYLLENRQDQFVEALAHKMTTFALGRPLSFGDRSHITRIAADLRMENDGLATLVHLIVQSEIFRTK